MPSSFCIHYVSESGRPSSGHRTGNGQSLFQFPRRVEPKNVLTIRQLHSSPRLVSSIRFSSVAQLYLTLCNPIDCSTPGLHFHHQLLEFTQIHVHWVSDAIQPSHPLSPPSTPALSLSQHQGLFQWVSSSHQVAKLLEIQLQHQSFQWIFRTDFLLSLTGLISLLSKGLSRVFSNTTVQKHQFFGPHLSL